VADDEFEALDRLLAQLERILEVPADGDDSPPEWTWQKVALLEGSMGPDALGALLRRQGMSQARVEETLAVLARRRR
jgi:hypothetical protein